MHLGPTYMGGNRDLEITHPRAFRLEVVVPAISLALALLQCWVGSGILIREEINHRDSQRRCIEYPGIIKVSALESTH